MICLEGVANFSVQCRDVGPNPYKNENIIPLSPFPGLALERNQRNILDVQNTTALMREIL
jgi:hypothetical protein